MCADESSMCAYLKHIWILEAPDCSWGDAPIEVISNQCTYHSCYNDVIEALNEAPILIHSWDKLGASEFVCSCEQFDAGERTFGRKSLLLNVKVKSCKYLGSHLNTNNLMGCRLFSFLWNFMDVLNKLWDVRQPLGL